MSPRRVWLMSAALMVALGSVGSVFSAIAVAHNDAQRSHQALMTSSLAIASTLQLAIQHEQDLAASAGVYFAENPNGTQRAFREWTTLAGAFKRYPEVLGISELNMVSAPRLSAFAARAEADPAGTLTAGGTFQVVPAGVRPFYCLVSASQIRVGQPIPAAGLDYCDSALGPQIPESSRFRSRCLCSVWVREEYDPGRWHPRLSWWRRSGLRRSSSPVLCWLDRHGHPSERDLGLGSPRPPEHCGGFRLRVRRIKGHSRCRICPSRGGIDVNRPSQWMARPDLCRSRRSASA